MKAGDVFVSLTGPLRFTVLRVNAGDLVVNVERHLVTKDGEITVDTRERAVPASVVPYFIKGYRKGKANGQR